MGDYTSLISLFQIQKTVQGHGSGYKYKLGSQPQIEVDPTMDCFTDFTEGILSYLHSNCIKYYQDRTVSPEDFNPVKYSFPIYEKITANLLPVIVDVRFRFMNLNETGFFKKMFVYKCIYYLQDIILGCFKVDHDDDKVNKILICFYLESDPWFDGEHYNVNMRFHFPYAKVNIEYLNRIIISNFKRCLTENNDIKNYITETPVDSLDIIVPKIGEYVCMYGSKEKETDAPFYLRSAYSFIPGIEGIDADLDEKFLPFYYNFMVLDDILFDEHTLVRNNLIDKDNFEGNTKWYTLPFILSLHFTDKILKINEGINISDIFIKETKTVTQKFDTGANTTKNPVQMLEQLLPLISKSRFTLHYKYYWYSIGKAIYNICYGTPYGLKLFENYTDDEELNDLCKEIYEDFQNETLDIRLIKSYALTDSPNQYDMWLKSQYESKLVPSLTKQSLDVADLISEILGLDFVYDRNNDQWYYFNGTRLVLDKKAYMLINFIHKKDGKVINAFNDFRQEMITKSNESGDRTQKQYFETILKQISELLYRLADLGFVKRIVEACQVYMFDDNLYVKTDENNMIMACKDSIIECYDHSIVSRPGVLQDYITKCTNVSFPTTYDMSHPKVQFMMKYYGQVHTDPSLCHFFMKHLASLLIGGNLEKYFINWIGEANASKSQVLKFVQAALGEYCVIIPNHIITLNINSNTGKPEPALERAKGARAGIAAETDRTEKWHVGNIKKFTGGDVYFNRTLNKEGCERVLSWQLIAMSNLANDAPNADEAFFVREIIIPFLSKWVDNAPFSIDEQYATRRFPIDLDFSSKIKYYAQAQLFLMFHYFPTYRQEGIRVLPELVKRVTFKHQRDLDVIFNFIHSKLQSFFIGDPKDKVPDLNKKSRVDELHALYKRWYRAAYGNDVIPLDQFKFTDEMTRRIGSPNDDGIWFGISQRQIEPSTLI
uniref:C962R-like N-terminal AEP domain-containing protein n=1 Tax=viral metagenome TaxID=1070528 RepID=A0A6C0BCU9_9ZZZZ